MTQEWRIWTSASTPLFIFLVLSTFLCMGGGWLVFVYLSPPSICSYSSGLLLFMLFSFRFFSFIVSFFLLLLLCSSKEKEEEKGKQDEWKNDKQQKIKKANQGDKGGIARKTWNTKIKKHNKEEKQNRKQKNRPFVVFVVLGCWPLSGRNLAREKGPKTLWNKGFCCFFLFICWSVIGQANEKNNNNNKTTKTRQQNYKTTKKQYRNKNKTTTITTKQQQ